MRKLRNIYLITTTEKGDERTGWDCYRSHVAIADTPKRVREIVPSADEGELTWRSKEYSIVKKIGSSYLKEQVVLSDFNAG